jgi:pimeloyl-ACP methyl ester carboxylesterase
MHRLAPFAAVLALAAPAAAQDAREISFAAADGTTVYADVHAADAPMSAPVIVLFHQAGGDARGEYGPIIPRLVAHGVHAIAVDARGGGDRFGGENRTAAAFDSEPGYCDAEQDLLAAIGAARAEGFDGPLTIAGSSYSAGLTVRIAAEHGELIDGAIAFSPAAGGPMADCNPNELIDDVRVPLLALRPANEAAIPAVADQLAMFEAAGHATFVADPGTHGASMLVASRVDGDVEPAWEAVLAHLDRVVADACPLDRFAGDWTISVETDEGWTGEGQINFRREAERGCLVVLQGEFVMHAGERGDIYSRNFGALARDSLDERYELFVTDSRGYTHFMAGGPEANGDWAFEVVTGGEPVLRRELWRAVAADRFERVWQGRESEDAPWADRLVQGYERAE